MHTSTRTGIAFLRYLCVVIGFSDNPLDWCIQRCSVVRSGEADLFSARNLHLRKLLGRCISEKASRRLLHNLGASVLAALPDASALLLKRYRPAAKPQRKAMPFVHGRSPTSHLMHCPKDGCNMHANIYPCSFTANVNARL